MLNTTTTFISICRNKYGDKNIKSTFETASVVAFNIKCDIEVI